MNSTNFNWRHLLKSIGRRNSRWNYFLLLLLLKSDLLKVISLIFGSYGLTQFGIGRRSEHLLLDYVVLNLNRFLPWRLLTHRSLLRFLGWSCVNSRGSERSSIFNLGNYGNKLFFLTTVFSERLVRNNLLKLWLYFLRIQLKLILLLLLLLWSPVLSLILLNSIITVLFGILVVLVLFLRSSDICYRSWNQNLFRRFLVSRLKVNGWSF